MAEMETQRLMPSSSEKPQKLTIVQRLTYGCGEGSLAIIQLVKGFFFNTFLLEVAEIPPFYAGMILLLAKFVDAVSDVVVGNLSDKTKSRFGRRRSWMLYGALPLCIAYVFLWWVPPLGTDGRIAYFQIMAVILSLTYTLVAIPYTAMTPELTDDYDERTTLTMFRLVFLMGIGTAATFAHSLMINMFHHVRSDGVRYVDDERGYFVSGCVLAAVMFVPIMIVFFGTAWSNRGQEKQATEHMPFFLGFKIVMKNRAFLSVMFVYFFSQISVQFVQNNLYLYCKYVAGGESIFSFALLTLQMSVLLFSFVWNLVARRIGKKNTYFIGGSFLLVAFVLIFFFPYKQSKLMLPVAAFAGIGVAAIMLLPASMLPDVIETDELETGYRREGIFYSLMLFFQKLGLSLGLAISNFVLGAAGYVAPPDVPVEDGGPGHIPDTNESPEVIRALRMLSGVIPAVIIILSLAIMYVYPITKDSHNRTRMLLQAKRLERKNTH